MDGFTRQFALEHQVHDVDEHFRRSLASMQSKHSLSASFAGSTTESRTKRSRLSGEGESHQIVIAENAASTRQQQLPPPRVSTSTTPTLIPTVTSQGIQYILSSSAGAVGSTPSILTRVSSNGSTPVRAAIQTPQVLYSIPTTSQKVVNGGAAIAMAALGGEVARDTNSKKTTGEMRKNVLIFLDKFWRHFSKIL